MWMAPVDRITHRVWAWSVGWRATLAPKPPSPAQVGVLMNPGLHSVLCLTRPGLEYWFSCTNADSTLGRSSGRLRLHRGALVADPVYTPGILRLQLYRHLRLPTAMELFQGSPWHFVSKRIEDQKKHFLPRGNKQVFTEIKTLDIGNSRLKGCHAVQAFKLKTSLRLICPSQLIGMVLMAFGDTPPKEA